MQLPYSDTLEIQYLSWIFDNTSECYKFFWFKAIVSKVLQGKRHITYEELVDEMIADAWYMVVEYHLNLGPRDTLDSLVFYLQQISQLKSSEKKENIINYLRNCTDKEVLKQKRILTKKVPYRIQAPFMDKVKGKEWEVSESALISKINRERRLMYYFDALLEIQPIHEIYGHMQLSEKDISIDHFVPWFMMNFGICILPHAALTAVRINFCAF